MEEWGNPPQGMLTSTYKNRISKAEYKNMECPRHPGLLKTHPRI
jgi:hypothetical protein